jgi:hypothetical protein
VVAVEVEDILYQVVYPLEEMADVEVVQDIMAIIMEQLEPEVRVLMVDKTDLAVLVFTHHLVVVVLVVGGEEEWEVLDRCPQILHKVMGVWVVLGYHIVYPVQA